MSMDYLPAVDVARRRLSPWKDSLSTVDLTVEVLDAVDILLIQFPCVAAQINASPPTISADDLRQVMNAAGTLAAMRVLTTTTLTAAGGASRIKTPDFEIQFTAPSADQRTELTDNLARAVGLISCVIAGRKSVAAGVSLFGVNGSRRTIEARQSAYVGQYGAYGWLGGVFPDGWWGL